MKKTKAKKTDRAGVSRETETARTVEIGDAPRVAEKDDSLRSRDAGGKPERDTESPEDVAETPDAQAKLRANIEKLEDSLLRARADYQNLQRRAAIERSEAIRFANAALMKSLLGVIDDFERSLASSSTSGEREAVVDGVRLVYQNLMKALRDQGLETIVALHKPFDPSVHEAIMQQPSADHEAGTVMEELAKGYRLCERVLRPAKVIVSKAVDVVQEPTKTPAEEESDQCAKSEPQP